LAGSIGLSIAITHRETPVQAPEENQQMSVAIDTAVHDPETAPAARAIQLVEVTRTPDRYELLPWLPCTVALDIPVVHFTVAHLLALGRGSIVETAYHQSSDLPLHVNGQLVGCTEFEVVGDRLAVRLTELS
jgi:flagellar motor switch/type III secretory pathway protein FliN